jgi:hypothetical protein
MTNSADDRWQHTRAKHQRHTRHTPTPAETYQQREAGRMLQGSSKFSRMPVPVLFKRCRGFNHEQYQIHQATDCPPVCGGAHALTKPSATGELNISMTSKQDRGHLAKLKYKQIDRKQHVSTGVELGGVCANDT